jgi:hypothetical protein
VSVAAATLGLKGGVFYTPLCGSSRELFISGRAGFLLLL